MILLIVSLSGRLFFLERRELGIVNLGPAAEVRCLGGQSYRLEYLDALYLGRGEQAIEFASTDPAQSAQLYCLSAPAHQSYPSRIIRRDEARQIELGTQENANERLITQYLHPDVLPTCQLCMGVTHLKQGSVWNTMPAHTHERRMEAYLYFNLDPSQVVFHLMGSRMKPGTLLSETISWFFHRAGRFIRAVARKIIVLCGAW